MERDGRKSVTRVVAWIAAVAIGAAVLLAAIVSSHSQPQDPGPIAPKISIRGHALRFPATQILFVSRSSGFALAADETPGTVTGPLSIYRTGNGGRLLGWTDVVSIP